MRRVTASGVLLAAVSLGSVSLALSPVPAPNATAAASSGPAAVLAEIPFFHFLDDGNGRGHRDRLHRQRFRSHRNRFRHRQRR